MQVDKTTELKIKIDLIGIKWYNWWWNRDRIPTPIFLMRGLKMRNFLASSVCRLRSIDAASLRSSGVARCWNLNILDIFRGKIWEVWFFFTGDGEITRVRPKAWIYPDFSAWNRYRNWSLWSFSVEFCYHGEF